MSFEQQWGEYRERLQQFLARRVDDPDEVQDLLQEVAIALYRHAGEIRDPGAVRPWLYQVARRAVADHYRGRVRRQLPPGEVLWFEREEASLWEGLGACVEPLLAALPEPRAALLRAVDLERREQRALAAELGIPESTLKSRVQKAREELRWGFERCCAFPRDEAGRVREAVPRSPGCDDC